MRKTHPAELDTHLEAENFPFRENQKIICKALNVSRLIFNYTTYIPVTALNQPLNKPPTPPLDTIPPTMQARLHKPTIAANTPTTTIDTFDTSVVASARIEVPASALLCTCALLIRPPPDI
jgi:hypothetical protein